MEEALPVDKLVLISELPVLFGDYCFITIKDKILLLTKGLEQRVLLFRISLLAECLNLQIVCHLKQVLIKYKSQGYKPCVICKYLSLNKIVDFHCVA